MTYLNIPFLRIRKETLGVAEPLQLHNRDNRFKSCLIVKPVKSLHPYHHSDFRHTQSHKGQLGVNIGVMLDGLLLKNTLWRLIDSLKPVLVWYWKRSPIVELLTIRNIYSKFSKKKPDKHSHAVISFIYSGTRVMLQCLCYNSSRCQGQGKNVMMPVMVFYPLNGLLVSDRNQEWRPTMGVVSQRTLAFLRNAFEEICLKFGVVWRRPSFITH